MFEIAKTQNKNLIGEVNLPSSKSISHRFLMIKALSQSDFHINNLSDCNDTLMLQKAFQGSSFVLDFEDAGTPMRFFIAFAALKKMVVTITGNKGLKTRPIAPLVDALRQLGCKIVYLEKDGFVPVRIDQGINKSNNYVKVDATISSQFISALLLIAPSLSNGLTIDLNGNMSAMPYIDLTIDCMKQAGVNAVWLDQKIIVPAKNYRLLNEIKIEIDWSAATFIYALVAVSENSNIFIPGLSLDSLQGDRVTAYLFEFLGVLTKVENNGIRLSNSNSVVDKIKIDFTAIPDMFPAISAVCAILKIDATFTGIKNLTVKESNRLLAMKDNLAQTGAHLNIENDHQASFTFVDKMDGIYHFKSFNDHRIAMACSLFTLYNNINIDDETVVKKSFPKYWEVLKSLIN